MSTNTRIFIALGALLGLIVNLVAIHGFGMQSDYIKFFPLGGCLIGAVVSVVLDKRRSK